MICWHVYIYYVFPSFINHEVSMIRYALPALLFAAALPAHAQAPAKETPLIERSKIFGNPSKSGGKISRHLDRLPEPPKSEGAPLLLVP